MYKIKTKLAVYCLAYFLPVRMPETGVSRFFSIYHLSVRFGMVQYVLRSPIVEYVQYENIVSSFKFLKGMHMPRQPN